MSPAEISKQLRGKATPAADLASHAAKLIIRQARLISVLEEDNRRHTTVTHSYMDSMAELCAIRDQLNEYCGRLTIENVILRARIKELESK